MIKAPILGACAALALVSNAFAAEGTTGESGMSYSYLEAGYLSADIDGVGKNPDGFGIAGSYGFTPMVHGYTEYSRISISGFKLQTYEVGLGLSHSLNSSLDLIGRAGYIKGKVEDLGDDDGFSLAAGLRGRPVDNLEVEGFIHYADLDTVGDNTSFELGARYFFVPQFAFGAAVDIDDDVKLWKVGFRWNFK
jgi:hypothetical protein